MILKEEVMDDESQNSIAPREKHKGLQKLFNNLPEHLNPIFSEYYEKGDAHAISILSESNIYIKELGASLSQMMPEKAKSHLQSISESEIRKQVKKQVNIGSVLAYAAPILEDEEDISSDPVNKDWMTRFFNTVEDISDEDMQILWAKVLAGEIINPNSYSLRTLDFLKNISKNEAELISNIGKLAIVRDKTAFIPLKSNISVASSIKELNLKFSNILELEDLNVIKIDNKLIKLQYQANSYDYNYKNRINQVVVHHNGYNVCIYFPEDIKDLSFPAIIFTSLGFELLHLINSKSLEEDLLKYFKNVLLQKYPQFIKISANELIYNAKGKYWTLGNDTFEI